MEQTIIIDQSLLYTIPDHETNLTITLKYTLLFKIKFYSDKGISDFCFIIDEILRCKNLEELALSLRLISILIFNFLSDN